MGVEHQTHSTLRALPCGGPRLFAWTVRPFGPACLALAIMLAGAASARADGIACSTVTGNLISNCGFEDGNLTDWTVGGATYGGFDGNFYGVQGNENDPPAGATALGPVDTGSWAAYFASDTTETIAPITLSQTLTGPEDVVYTISFYIDQDGYTADNSVSVTFAGADVYSVTNMAPTNLFALETITYTDRTVVNPTLEFSFENVPAYFFLDDVSVTEAPIAPEPPGLLLCGSAVGLLLLAGRKRRGASSRKSILR